MAGQAQREGKLTPAHYVAQEKEVSDSLGNIMKLKQLPLYGQVHSYLDNNKPLPEALKSAAESLSTQEGLMVQDYNMRRVVLNSMGKALGYENQEVKSTAPPPPEEKPTSVPTEQKKNLVQRVTGEITNIPQNINKTLSSWGTATEKFLKGAGVKTEPSHPSDVPAKLSLQLHREYGLPGDAIIHFSEGDKVLTKDKEGKNITVGRADLATIAKPNDYLWDAQTGTMYQLGLYLTHKGKTPELDTEEEVFKE